MRDRNVHLTVDQQKLLVEQMVFKLVERAGIDCDLTETADGCTINVVYRPNHILQLLGRDAPQTS